MVSRKLNLFQLKPLTQIIAIALLVFLLFFSIYAYVYHQSTQSLKQTTIRQTLIYLQQGASEIATAFSGYSSLSHLANLDATTVLAKVSSDGLVPSDYAHLLHLSEYLGDAFPSTNCINRIALFFDTESGILCSDNLVYDNFKVAYDNGLLYAEGVDYSEFREMIIQYANSAYTRRFTPVIEIISSSSQAMNANTFMYIRKLSVSQCDVYAIVFINADKFMLSIAGDSPYGTCCILTDHYGLIYSTQEIADPPSTEVHYNKENDSILLRVPVNTMGITAYYVLYEKDILSQISRFSFLWNILLAVFIVLMAGLCFLLCIYLIYPLQKILLKIQNTSTGNYHLKNSFMQIENEISMLSTRNKQLQSNVSQWQPMLRNNLLDKLLHQEFLTPTERKMLQSLPSLKKDSFRVVIVGNISRERFTMQNPSEAIEQIITDILPNALVYQMDGVTFAMLIPSEISHPQAHEEFIVLMRDLLHKLNCFVQNEDAFAIGIGFSYQNLLNAHRSFKEANAAFHEADTWNRSDVVSYEKTGLGVFDYHLSYEELEKIYNSLKAGDADGACTELDKLFKRDLGENSPNKQSRVFCRQFFNDITGMLVRLSSQLNLMPVLDTLTEYDDTLPFDETLEIMHNFFHYISEIIISSRSSSVLGLSESMRLYVKKNYTDSNLSLTMLSDMYSMSETSLSKFFKVKLGINFSAYLEKLRLGEAETLLINSTHSIKDIAKKVGYSNITTFNKAFKRKYGISPTEWIIQHKKQPAPPSPMV